MSGKHKGKNGLLEKSFNGVSLVAVPSTSGNGGPFHVATSDLLSIPVRIQGNALSRETGVLNCLPYLLQAVCDSFYILPSFFFVRQ